MTILGTHSGLQGESGGHNSTVLSFKGVSTEPAPFFDTPLWDVSFKLLQGELLLVRMERGRFRLPLADLATGILEPSDGVVEFFTLHISGGHP